MWRKTPLLFTLWTSVGKWREGFDTHAHRKGGIMLMDLENERLTLPRLAVLYSSLAMHFVSLAFMDHYSRGCSKVWDLQVGSVYSLSIAHA
jgi:hypothetical protein